MKKYYSFEVKDSEADLYIFGDITSFADNEKARDAYSIVKELQEMDADTIRVHINSYGGSVAEGLAIYNTLKNHKAAITTICDGFACSAASVVFMAGEKRIINEASLLMIHNPWTYASGNAADFRKQADDLDKIAQASINAYMSKVNISEEKIKQLLDEETWLTADECVEMGFATETEKAEEDGINQSAFMVIRDKVMNKIEPEEESERVSIEELANLICSRMENFFEEKKSNKPEAKESGWDSFFNRR